MARRRSWEEAQTVVMVAVHRDAGGELEVGTVSKVAPEGGMVVPDGRNVG